MFKPSSFVLSVLLALSHSISAQWNPVCSTGNGFVDDFEVFQDTLYATGFFTNVCGIPANHLIRYDGTTWEAVGTGYVNAGHDLCPIGDELYFVGYQPAIDSNWVYRLNGNVLEKIGEGVYLTNAVTGFSKTANLYNVTTFNDRIVACGEFDRVGNREISGIMQWTGTIWDSLGSGLSGSITASDVMYPHTLCTFENDLIVGGNFLQAGGLNVHGIARWDGTTWYAMGDGFNGSVYTVTEFNGELYAAGDFTMSGTTALQCVARWNGSSWENPGIGVYYQDAMYYSFVHTLRVIDNRLFVTGGFDRVTTTTDTLMCQAIFAFDGMHIDTLAGGIPGKEIEALVQFDGNLYAGGGVNNSNSFIARYEDVLGFPEISAPEAELFPNPSSDDHITVSSAEVPQEIRVFDLSGRCVLSIIPAVSSVTELTLPGTGSYILEIRLNELIVRKTAVIGGK